MPKVTGFRTNKDSGRVFPLFSGQTSLGDFINVQAQDSNRVIPQNNAKRIALQKKIQRIRQQLAETELKDEAKEIKRKTGLLVQPQIVNSASIPEALTKPALTGFKTYSQNARSFEVSEEDFIKRYIEKDRARLAGNLKYWENELAALGPKATKKRQDVELSIHITKRGLEAHDSKDDSKLKYLEHDAKRNYNELVKAAIKKGEPVPDAVIQQKPEFQIARDARRRYEKGLHTSFANKSAAVNAVMFLEKGYKVKRQDGKEILPYQIKEIDTGINEIQAAIGSVKDVMQKSDLTIAHTSGKFPFLDGSASGVFHPAENTITTGVEINFLGHTFTRRSLGHEWAHWLDYAAGKDNRHGYELYSNGKSQRKIKSFKEALSNAERYSNPLYRQAEEKMNNDWEIRKLFNPSLSIRGQTKEDEQKAKFIKSQIGTYYRDPREIWARLVEQYIADHHAKETVASQSPEFYHEHPAYWNKENFAELKPLVKTEIDRRLQLARGT